MAADLSKSIPHILEQLVLTAGIKGVSVYTKAVDFPSIAAGAIGSVDVTVTGVALGDIVLFVGPADFSDWSGDIDVVSASVTATNTVRVVARNSTGGAIDASIEDATFIVLDRT